MDSAGIPEWNRSRLEEHYDSLLQAGLRPEEFESFKTTGRLGGRIVLQASSGSSGQKPLLIPRTSADILDIHRRIIRTYLKARPQAPRKIAMIGGVSHAQAAHKMTIDEAVLISLGVEQISELNDFNPDVLACYPSILRSLMANPRLELAGLKGIKLGGEALLDADLELIRKRFPAVIVLEQYGSTEMPAIAFGCYPDFSKNGLVPESDRFSFAPMPEGESAPVVVEDLFPDLLLKIPGPYDSGDEAVMSGGRLWKPRRRDHRENAYRPLQETLLAEGCVNVQVDLSSRTLFCEGYPSHTSIEFGSERYRLVQAPMNRIAGSNKLPLMVRDLTPGAVQDIF